MTPDLYLDLSIDSTGGAGTQGDPYRSFADVPTYSSGGRNVLITKGNASLTGAQSVKCGYNYFSRTREVIGAPVSEIRFNFDDVAQDVSFRNLVIFMSYSDNDDASNSGGQTVTFDECALRGSLSNTNSAWIRDRRNWTFNYCDLIAGFGNTSASLNNQTKLFYKYGSANPKVTINRCSCYFSVSHYNDAGEYLLNTSTDNYLTHSLFYIISATPGTLLVNGLDTNTGNYSDANGDVIIGTSVDPIGFIDPATGVMELIDSSPLLAL